ncbi:hypothetical protein ACH42_13630 [Endozoicomonas sp. (ex Bugula neritina AB1)]|nr:hypothetical protein ACH42_13630 [Endozoicomonas sp. (ex Bugula neritina AB1)]
MRWIILVLIFTNLGYFAWGSFQESKGIYQISSARPEGLAESGRRLILLSESTLTSAINEKTTTKVQPLKEDEEPPEHSLQCLALGPFQSSDLVDQVQQRLFSLGIESRERADKNNQALDYWVHIPPLASRDAAIRLLRELQSQKIDSFVITQGELSNGISLGLFSKYDSAKAVRRRLMDADYPVEIKTLSQQSGSWWLELDSDAEDKLDNYFWDELVRRMPGIKKAKKNCKGIASTTEFL